MAEKRADVDQAIRERIRKRMGDLGMTGPMPWSELADYIGQSRKDVPRWVAGKSRIPAHLIEAMDRAGFASASWLLTGAEAPGVEDAARRIAAARMREAADRLEQLTPSAGGQAGTGGRDPAPGIHRTDDVDSPGATSGESGHQGQPNG